MNILRCFKSGLYEAMSAYKNKYTDVHFKLQNYILFGSATLKDLRLKQSS